MKKFIPITAVQAAKRVVSRREVMVTVPSGEIAIETGGDGTFLMFDCECLDALPYCKAVCCTLPGIEITLAEAEQLGKGRPPHQAIVTPTGDGYSMRRAADAYCVCSDRSSRLCGIYPERPDVCSSFHCTRGADMRGWKLGLDRLPEVE